MMTLAESGSESDVLAAGLSVVLLTIGMYVAASILIGIKIYIFLKSKK